MPSNPVIVVPGFDSNLNELRYTSITYVPSGSNAGFYAVGKNPDDNDTATHSAAYLATGSEVLEWRKITQPSSNNDAYFRWGPITRDGNTNMVLMTMNGWYNPNNDDYYNDDKWHTIQWVLPKKYCFENEHEKEVMLSRNFRRINEEVTQLTASLLGKETSA